MMSVATLAVNAQVYTEYFDHLSASDEIEGQDGWYLNPESSHQEVGANGEGSPLIGSADPMFYGDYKGNDEGKVVVLDSAVAYYSDQRSTNKVITNGVDTLRLPASGGVYTAFLFKPLLQSKEKIRDFFGYEFSATNISSSRGRVFMEPDGNDVQFGVSRNVTKVTYGLDTSKIFVGGMEETYLIVLKYEMGDPLVDKDDTVKLWINPDVMLPEDGQAYISSKDEQDDQTEGDIVRLTIRQRGQNAEISGIRSGTSWEDVLTGSDAENIATSVSTTQAELAVDIYPNPSNGAFTVANVAGADVMIYDVTGKVVYQQTNIDAAQSINLNYGFYFVSVKTKDAQKVTKVIVK